MLDRVDRLCRLLAWKRPAVPAGVSAEGCLYLRLFLATISHGPTPTCLRITPSATPAAAYEVVRVAGDKTKKCSNQGVFGNAS